MFPEAKVLLYSNKEELKTTQIPFLYIDNRRPKKTTWTLTAHSILFNIPKVAFVDSRVFFVSLVQSF